MVKVLGKNQNCSWKLWEEGVVLRSRSGIVWFFLSNPLKLIAAEKKNTHFGIDSPAAAMTHTCSRDEWIQDSVSTQMRLYFWIMITVRLQTNSALHQLDRCLPSLSDVYKSEGNKFPRAELHRTILRFSVCSYCSLKSRNADDDTSNLVWSSGSVRWTAVSGVSIKPLTMFLSPDAAVVLDWLFHMCSFSSSFLKDDLNCSIGWLIFSLFSSSLPASAFPPSFPTGTNICDQNTRGQNTTDINI